MEERTVELRAGARRAAARRARARRRNEELHQSNKELDDFAYIASHDLKEPLRGIHNFSNFLLEDYADKLDDEGRSKLETLIRLTRRMETLIDSLLQFSRLGRVDLAIDGVDLNEIVAEVARLARHHAAEETGRGARPPAAARRALPTACGCGEIFYNLIVNAIKYNDKPEKWIEIGVAGATRQRRAAGLLRPRQRHRHPGEAPRRRVPHLQAPARPRQVRRRHRRRA